MKSTEFSTKPQGMENTKKIITGEEKIQHTTCESKMSLNYGKGIVRKSSQEDSSRYDVHITDLLHEAVARGQVKLIKILIDGGLNVESRSRGGLTPLMDLCSSMNRVHEDKCTELIEYLLRKGADKESLDMWGNTSYDYAKSRGASKGILRKLSKVRFNLEEHVKK